MSEEENPRSDAVLLTLVRAMNNFNDSNAEGIGVVLVVGGVIISGKIVPNWLWFNKVEEKISQGSAGGSSSNGGLSELFHFFGDELASMRDDAAKLAELQDKLPARAQQTLMTEDRTEFIHLDDARVFQPGQLGMPGNGMLWRGRLKDVAGWSLGLFSADV